MVREDVGVKTANEVLRFLLELCMLAAFAHWGANTCDNTAVSVLIALAAAALAATTLAIVFAVAVALNTLLLHAGSGEI
jgi:hypothetical protein